MVGLKQATQLCEAPGQITWIIISGSGNYDKGKTPPKGSRALGKDFQKECYLKQRALDRQMDNPDIGCSVN